MKPTDLAKHVRTLRGHAETIVVRCRAVEDAITRGEMFGVDVPASSIEANVKAIEKRMAAAAAMIGIQPTKEGRMTSEASTTTWETLVEQYRERAARDDARIEELRQRTEHWHDTAQILKRQRGMAEEERDEWKIRAMASEQQRQALQAERDALHAALGVQP